MMVSRALLCVALLGCGKDGAQIECGRGTELKGHTCQVIAVAAPADSAVARTPVVVADAATSPTPTTSWTYESKADAMRGVSSDLATITSKNDVDLGNPYGLARLVLIVRHDPAGTSVPGDHVIVGIVPGQLACHSDGCAISYKVDDRPVAKAVGFEISSTRNGAIFLEGDGRWAANLNGASHLTIEVPIYGHAPHQFEFDVTGFKSPIPAPPPPKATPAKAKTRGWCYELSDTPEPVCWPTQTECAVRQSTAGNSALTECKEQ